MKDYLNEDGYEMMVNINCNTAKDILLYPTRQFQVLSSFISQNEVSIIELKEV